MPETLTTFVSRLGSKAEAEVVICGNGHLMQWFCLAFRFELPIFRYAKPLGATISADFLLISNVSGLPMTLHCIECFYAQNCKVLRLLFAQLKLIRT